jgi:uncharacterized protein (TIGR00251 family)
MIEISKHPEGCVLSVRVQPGARRNGIQGEGAGALRVAVTAPPDRGKANHALVVVLREALGLKNSQIQLIGGLTHRQKRLLIRDYSADHLRKKIAAKLEEIVVRQENGNHSGDDAAPH